MVMSLHGDKVDSMKKDCGGRMDHNQVIEIAQQVVRCLQKVHSIGYVHCDIKPHNILFTTSDEDNFDEDGNTFNDDKYTLIDFGICSRYLDSDGEHIKREKTTKFRGSIEFCAADVLAQFYPTRKHDMESLMYTILHLLKNKKSLWKSSMEMEGDRSSTKCLSMRQKLKKLSIKKKSVCPEYICAGIKNSTQFVDLYKYIAHLDYAEEPDYDLIVDM